jgi:hypothetical protein
MRLIERQMNAAISNSAREWKKDNTVVQTSEDGISRVFLHGNQIAEVGDTWIQLFDGGWQTVTTKSRLNAILRAHGNGEGIFQKKFEWFISTSEGTVEFENGMILA